MTITKIALSKHCQGSYYFGPADNPSFTVIIAERNADGMRYSSPWWHITDLRTGEVRRVVSLASARDALHRYNRTGEWPPTSDVLRPAVEPEPASEPTTRNDAILTSPCTSFWLRDAFDYVITADNGADRSRHFRYLAGQEEIPERYPYTAQLRSSLLNRDPLDAQCDLLTLAVMLLDA